MSKPTLVLAGLALMSAGFAQSEAIEYTKKKIIDRIKLFGERRVTVHFREVNGDRQAYNITNDGGFGDRRITDLGYLRAEGRDVLGWLNFDANIQDSRFIDPQASRYRLWFDNRMWTAEYGDIRAGIPTRNRFVTFGNSVNGLSAGYKSEGFQAGIIRTEARGEPRSVSFQGTNSAGPYYLQSSQIIRGSERVEVDGVLQSLGNDYTIDYDLGAITFLNRQTLESKIISPTSTIVATYESFNFSGSAGRLEGAALSYDFGAAGRIGLTGARQVTGNSGGLSTRLEKFQGFGPPSTPYFLQFRPLLTEPVVIRVDGVLQTQNVDWRFDNDNPSIFYFNRFMPASSNIDVLYTPTPTGNVTGDREVVGIDYSINFGGTGNLTYAQAFGRETNTPTPRSGTARSLNGRYSVGPWSLASNYRDVPADFVSTSSATLNRNERVLDWRLGLKAGKNGQFNFNNSNSSILTFNSSNSTFQNTRFVRTSADYTLGVDPSVGWPLTLSAGRNVTDTGISRNQIDTVGVSTNRVLGGLTTSLSLDEQRVSGSQSAQVTNARIQTSYRAGSEWDFSMGYGLNQVRSGGQSGQGRDLLGAINYRPTDDFSARLSLSEYDSGSVSSIPGLNTGFGAGYDGNGFTSGTGTTFTGGATNGQNTSLSLRWQANERLGLRASGLIYRSFGSVSSNTRTESASFGMDYDLGEGHFLGGDLNLSTTTFGVSSLKSTATNATGFISGGLGKLAYRSSASVLLSGGNSQFAQDNVSFDLFMDYKLGQRQKLGFSANYGNVTGYLPQSQLDLSLVYQYQLWESLALNVRYRFANNRNSDPLLSSGAYRANTLDFEFAFNFGR
ncbi:hypothetical protein C0431_03560 [bacterium]|nr:hypothetical protein [bacterium]